MAKSLLNITKRGKTLNEVMRSNTGVKDIIESAMHERTVEGHLSRMSNTRLAKITSEWTPREGERVRRRFKRRWRDNIEEVGSIQRMGLAQDRSA